ncbi:Lysine decarboxylase 2, constitutive [Klebsiella aerogenes]|nr:Lysine decarboxylase 2, constitutive [Klebsiella aerogenes]
MSGDRVPGKVIFETQSTHKMLAALSQASLIHIKGSYDEDTFNEAFMMHTSTSPSYPIVASIETAAADAARQLRKTPDSALHRTRATFP